MGVAVELVMLELITAEPVVDDTFEPAAELLDAVTWTGWPVWPDCSDAALVSAACSVTGKTGHRCPVVTSPANWISALSFARTDATGAKTVRGVPA